MTSPAYRVSIIIPCLNEEESVGKCIDTIKGVIQSADYAIELIVVDNGSTDRSREIIQEKIASIPHARLVVEEKRGYGRAYSAGMNKAEGELLFLADADCTYDFLLLPIFITEIEKGNDLVIGNRFNETMAAGAMPFARKYIGNPILSGLLRCLYNVSVNDCHSGMRLLTREAYKKMHLKCTGMEFASEMIISAARNNLKIKEIPISYKQRVGDSKLHPLQDAWRHVQLMVKLYFQ